MIARGALVDELFQVARGAEELTTGSALTRRHSTELPTKQVVGKRIRAVRLRRNWTQRRLVFALRQEALRAHGYPPTDASLKAMVSRWENGHRLPDSYNLRLLAAALRVPVSTFAVREADASVPHRRGAIGRQYDRRSASSGGRLAASE